MSSPWVDTLPEGLKGQVQELITTTPSSIPVLNELYQYLQLQHETKRRKIDGNNSNNQNGETSKNVNNGDAIKMLSDYSISINRKLVEEEIIFELPSISFQSPVRKKMNLVLHLLPENGANPILLIVNSTTLIPELSFIQLDKSIRLCAFLPILGLSTQDAKRNIGSLCFWLHDEAVIDPGKNDPIICQINLDLIKKHLIKTGKIPATVESQMEPQTQPQGIKPINEAIIQFLTRQFKMVGFNLINYLPSCNQNRNSLVINEDSGIAISHKANTINDMLLIEAYKGSKDGTFFLFNKNEFNPAYMGFGFRKPILLYLISDIESYSFSDITKYTFTINFEIHDAKREKTELVSLSMIDQKYYSLIDDFLKLQDIENNSFNESLREKPSNKGGSGDANGSTDTPDAIAVGEDDDDDEEDDDNYQGGEEEDDDDDVAEEYDSNADNSSDGEDVEGEDEEDAEAEDDDTLQQGVEEEE